MLAGKVSWPTYFRLTANRHFTLLRPLPPMMAAAFTVGVLILSLSTPADATHAYYVYDTAEAGAQTAFEAMSITQVRSYPQQAQTARLAPARPPCPRRLPIMDQLDPTLGAHTAVGLGQDRGDKLHRYVWRQRVFLRERQCVPTPSTAAHPVSPPCPQCPGLSETAVAALSLGAVTGYFGGQAVHTWNATAEQAELHHQLDFAIWDFCGVPRYGSSPCTAGHKITSHPLDTERCTRFGGEGTGAHCGGNLHAISGVSTRKIPWNLCPTFPWFFPLKVRSGILVCVFNQGSTR